MQTRYGASPLVALGDARADIARANLARAQDGRTDLITFLPRIQREVVRRVIFIILHSY